MGGETKQRGGQEAVGPGVPAPGVSGEGEAGPLPGLLRKGAGLGPGCCGGGEGRAEPRGHRLSLS